MIQGSVALLYLTYYKHSLEYLLLLPALSSPFTEYLPAVLALGFEPRTVRVSDECSKPDRAIRGSFVPLWTFTTLSLRGKRIYFRINTASMFSVVNSSLKLFLMSQEQRVL